MQNKMTYLLLISLLWASTALAQVSTKNVVFQINHYLNGAPLVLNTTTSTDLADQQYNLSRAQLYLSQLSLVHNGGEVLHMPEQYLLVNANVSNYIIGELDLGTVEALNFSVGVDEAANHSDPATYSHGHPLALNEPSMHWGWTAGYRFIALEGTLYPGDSGTLTFQYHVVGDDYLTPVTLAVTGAMDANDLVIAIDLDWSAFLQNISIFENPFVHGSGPTIDAIVTNISTETPFTASEIVGIDNIDNTYSLYNYPNPFSENTTIYYNFDGYTDANKLALHINNIHGQTIAVYNNLAATGNVALNTILSPGLYVYTFYNTEKQAIAQRKMEVVR